MNEPRVVETSAGRHYILNGRMHRSNGPAIIWDNGIDEKWRLFGNWHRYYGPIDKFTNEWWIHDNLIKYD